MPETTVQLPEAYRNGTWESTADWNPSPGDIIRGPAEMIGGDLIAQVRRVNNQFQVIARVVHVIEPSLNGREADEEGGLPRAGGNSYTFPRADIRRFVPTPASEWTDINDPRGVEVGMYVRGTDFHSPTDVYEGAVLGVDYPYVHLEGRNPHSTRLDMRTWEVRNTPASTTDKASSSPGGLPNSSSPGGLPTWAQGKTLEQVRQWIHAETVRKYNNGSGPFCRDGADDFLELLDLPAVNETYPVRDETEDVRRFVNDVKASILRAGRDHSHTVTGYLESLGLQSSRRITVEVSDDTDLDLITRNFPGVRVVND